MGPRKHAIRRRAATGQVEQEVTPLQGSSLSKETTTQSGTVMISLRVPAELKTQLEARAATNHRNLSQECERALEHSFNPDAMLLDAVTIVKGYDRFTTGASYVRAMATAVYGDDVGETGFDLMQTLAMARMLHGSGVGYKIDQATLDEFRAAIDELERLSVIKTYTVERGRQGLQDASAGSSLPEAQGTSTGKALPKTAAEQARENRPLYLWVRDHLASRIASGEWKPNSPIPSEIDLASQLGVGPEFVLKALDLMTREGLLTLRTQALPSRPIFLVASSPSASRGASA